MRVINIHKRNIHQPKQKIIELIETLSTDEDKVWPIKSWPAIRLMDGLKEGSQGGHGSIRYSVHKYVSGKLILFKFSEPKGFNGFHKFEITEIENDLTEVMHTIEMNTSGTGIFTWVVVIRWLHDALIEDTFDNIENYFSTKKKKTMWSFWVKLLRYLLKPKRR